MLRTTMIVPILTIGLAAPVWAQQSNTVDQGTRQQADAVVAKYVDAINKGDAPTIAALFAQNFISITPSGVRISAAQVEDEIQGVHQRGLTLTAKTDTVQPMFGGQGIAVTAPYAGTFANDPGSPNVKGNFLFVLERAGNDWKVRVFTAARMLPQPPR